MTVSLRVILAAAFAALVLATAAVIAWSVPAAPAGATLRAGAFLAAVAAGLGWLVGAWIGAPLAELGRLDDALRGPARGRPSAPAYREAAELEAALAGVLGALREAYTDSEIAYSRAEAAADALSASEARIALAVEAAELGTFELDLATGQGTWDERVARITGLPAAKAPTFASWLDLVHPGDRERVAAAQAAAVATGMGELVEYRLVRPDGTLRHVAARGLVTGAGDGPGRLVGFVQDITARKLAAAAVEESEACYRTLADALPQKVWTTGADGLATFYNQAMLDYHGPIGTDMEDRFSVVHPDDLRRAKPLRDAAYEAQTPFEADVRLRRRDGAYRWHRIAMVPLARDGAVIGWLGTSLDIHASREAEAALRERDDRLRALTDNLPDSMVFQLAEDADGRLRPREVGANCERLNGFSADEAVADPERLMGRLFDEDRILLTRAIERAREDERPISVEVRARGAGGSARWLQVSAARRRLPDGTLVWDGVETDITIHKEAEGALQSLLADLSDGLRRKDEALAETNVRIRNALQVVLSLLRLQASGLATEDARRAFATALDRVRAIADAHHRLLQAPIDGAVDAGGFVRDLCQDIAQSGVAIRVDADRVALAPDRLLPLGLVVNELARNAARHARGEAGGALVDVALKADGATFSLKVADAGPGLPPGFDAARTEGLGLRIVRSLVDQLDGQLDWGPGPGGEGAAFTVTAPRASPERGRLQ
jgi:PAS domain S-box-containing protein